VEVPAFDWSLSDGCFVEGRRAVLWEEAVDEVAISTGGVVIAKCLHTLEDTWSGMGNTVLIGLRVFALLPILILSILFILVLFLPLVLFFLPFVLFLLLITMFQLIPIIRRQLFLTITADIDFESSVHFVIIQIHKCVTSLPSCTNCI
jgi:hypothetical protein